MELGIVGGTGPLGRGLATRFAQAGVRVRLGSRDAQRADEAATTVDEALGETSARGGSMAPRARGDVVGVVNAEAAAAELVVIAVPDGGLDAALGAVGEDLAGRTVISAVNPLAFDDDGPYPGSVSEGSVAQACAARLPHSRVVGAFHAVSSRALLDLEVAMDDDVPVLGDDADAVAAVVELIDRVEGMRGVAAGPLRLASVVESLTPLLIEVNKRHKTHAGVRLSRV